MGDRTCVLILPEDKSYLIASVGTEARGVSRLFGYSNRSATAVRAL